MGKFIDLTGRRFGRLTVRKMAGRGNSKQILWECECDCGGTAIVPTYHLNSGHTKSCGCYHRELSVEKGKQNVRHGMHGTRLYACWRSMKQRCYYPKSQSYSDYGERSIAVCAEWRDSFEAFRDWALANGYTDDLTIERKDPNGDYCPENCCWATMQEQQNNKRNNRMLTFNGETRTAPEWARVTGIPVTIIYNRMKYGWPPERILTEKLRTYTRRNHHGSQQ